VRWPVIYSQGGRNQVLEKCRAVPKLFLPSSLSGSAITSRQATVRDSLLGPKRFTGISTPKKDRKKRETNFTPYSIAPKKEENTSLVVTRHFQEWALDLSGAGVSPLGVWINFCRYSRYQFPPSHSFPPLVAAVLFAPAFSESPGSGRKGVIGA